MFCKKCVLKNCANFTRKHLCWSLFLFKVFKNTYFEEHLRTTASGFIGDTTLFHETILKKHTNGKTNFQDEKSITGSNILNDKEKRMM